VAPIAHYHMGGVRADVRMATRVPGLFAAGEAVGGANGANRLSGNAITEALVFGAKAGESAAAFSKKQHARAEAGAFAAFREFIETGRRTDFNPAQRIEELQALMQQDVGPFRTDAGLGRALERITALRRELVQCKPPAGAPFDTALIDWLDLDTMTQVAECVARAARARTESRGAHQREDFPGMDAKWQRNQVLAQ
jgi:succinate dehydrogenase/fumarate reductase flavoprotein subunit